MLLPLSPDNLLALNINQQINMKFRIAIAVLLALIFGLVAIPTFFIRGIVSTYFNPAFYEGSVVEESHEYLVDFLDDQISEDENVKDYFNRAQVDALVREYITSADLRTVVQDFISQMNNIFDGRKSNLIVVSLEPLRDGIPGMGNDIATHIVDGTPVCDEEIEDLTEFLKNGLPECVPQEIEKSSLINPLALEIEKNMLDMIPGEFSLDLNTAGEGDTASFTQLLFIFKYAQMILPLFMLILLLLMTLVVYKPYTRTMKFIGSSFALGGILSLIAGQLFSRIPDIFKESINGLNSFYSYLIDFIVARINTYSLYFIGIGILVILIGFYLSHYHDS